MTWHEVSGLSAKHRAQPSGRFDAQTWVDDQHQLWLYGGKVIRINGSEVQHLRDLWKFNPVSYQWSKVPCQNSSELPQFGKALSSYCLGNTFVFGHQIHKKIAKLWAYNVTSQFWSLIKSPANILENAQDCFTMWCNEDSGTMSLLCHQDKSVMILYYRIYKISTGVWGSQTFINEVNFTIAFGKNISKSRGISVWKKLGDLAFVYIWSNSNPHTLKSSALVSISHKGIVATEVNNTRPEYMSNRKGFIRWIDNNGNLNLLGGRITNISTNSSAAHWMLNTSSYKWSMVISKTVKPGTRFGACSWQVGDNLWLFGGYRKDGQGHVVVLNDFWIANTNKSGVHPSTAPTNTSSLPGDTLGLSLVHKLIISVVVLLVVMAISIRLCYKRELNQLMSRLRKNRVLYHQLNQEGDKSTRL